jgi:hypothetical protein
LAELEVYPVLQRAVKDIVPVEVALEVVTLLWGKVGFTLTEADGARLPCAFRVSAFGGWFFSPRRLLARCGEAEPCTRAYCLHWSCDVMLLCGAFLFTRRFWRGASSPRHCCGSRAFTLRLCRLRGRLTQTLCMRTPRTLPTCSLP